MCVHVYKQQCFKANHFDYCDWISESKNTIETIEIHFKELLK